MGTIVKNIKFHAKLRKVALAFSASATHSGHAAELQTPAPLASEPAAPPELSAEHALKELLEDLSRQIDAMSKERAQNIGELHELAIELSLVVASHIVKRELDADSLNLNDIVIAAIEQLLPAQEITVRLNPNDIVDLENIESSFRSDLADGIRFVQDAAIPRGGCFVEGDELGLLSTLEARLENMRDTLLQGIEYARVERRKTGGIGESLRRFPDRRKPA